MISLILGTQCRLGVLDESFSALAQGRESMDGIIRAIHNLTEIVNEHITHNRQPHKRIVGNDNHMIGRFQ